jgi:dTMP kinase
MAATYNITIGASLIDDFCKAVVSTSNMFFSFDGIDGTGKTTQMRMFCDALRAHGLNVVTCRDPGSTAVGEQIREILLNSDDSTPIGRRSEMLLYMAARAQLAEEVIRPALDAGKVVVCDRYLMANVVYQGHAGGLNPDIVREVGQVATAGLLPDCVFLLDMDPEAARRRLSRPLDRMESQGLEYNRKLREGFLSEASRPESRTRVIDADRSSESVHADIRRIAFELLRMDDVSK